MGNKPSFMLQDEEITVINEETGFSPAQIERLYSRFTALDKSGNGSLSRQDCLAIPELAINPVCDRIVSLIFKDCDEDHDRINFRQFMKVLATFRASHKSSPSSRSRQESLNHQQQQSILKNTPLLFDSIDPSPFTNPINPLSRHHSRHSSFHEGFQDIHQHHTTNQHSFHYAASSNHLPAPNNHHHHLFQNNHGHHNTNANNSNQVTNVDTTTTLASNTSINNNTLSASNHNASSNSLCNGQNNSSLRKSFIHLPLVDLDEPPNSRKQKLYFMFKVYDVNDDDLIGIDDLIAIIKMMVGTYFDDASVKRIAERTLSEADKNCDGFIDFEEFCAAFARKDIDGALRVRWSKLD